MANETETELAIQMAADNAHDKGYKLGIDTGMRAAHDRISAILSDPRVKGNETFALKLAAKSPTLSADDVGAMCEDLPKAIEGVSLIRQTTAEQVDPTGVNAIKPGPVENSSGHDGWSKAIDKVNARAGR